MRKIKVSIYEDKKSLRQSLELLLHNSPKIELVHSGQDCMNLLSDFNRQKPDVILMDIDMPGINGIEATKLIKSWDPNINIMMITVFEDNDNVFNALRAGATGYLIKSTTPEKIIESIVDIHSGGSPISAGIARKILQVLPVESVKTKSQSTLTKREEEVLKLLEVGNSVKMAAAQLDISYETARTYVRRIYDKLHVSSATSAVFKAKEKGWI